MKEKLKEKRIGLEPASGADLHEETREEIEKLQKENSELRKGILEIADGRIEDAPNKLYCKRDCCRTCTLAKKLRSLVKKEVK